MSRKTHNKKRIRVSYFTECCPLCYWIQMKYSQFQFMGQELRMPKNTKNGHEWNFFFSLLNRNNQRVRARAGTVRLWRDQNPVQKKNWITLSDIASKNRSKALINLKIVFVCKTLSIFSIDGMDLTHYEFKFSHIANKYLVENRMVRGDGTTKSNWILRLLFYRFTLVSLVCSVGYSFMFGFTFFLYVYV